MTQHHNIFIQDFQIPYNNISNYIVRSFYLHSIFILTVKIE